MKKLLAFCLTISVICIYSCYADVQASDTSKQVIKEAISKYKAKNYLGCISDLKLYVLKDPTNAVAWYYLGTSYMNIAMKQEAHDAFDKVIELNTVPQLTSYSIQAELCMENEEKCKYQDLTYDEIKQLKSDPVTFLNKFLAKQQNMKKVNSNDAEINKLITGKYPNNIHDDARAFINQQRASMQRDAINTH